MRLVSKSQYKRMPWKNGQGFTDEIAISPEGAVFPDEPFLWRLSAATVSKANTFSQFRGCDRWLAILQGSGLVLNGKPLQSGECVRFFGEDTVACAPIAGEVTDIGLIFDRTKVEARMEFRSLDSGANVLDLVGERHYIVCARGEFSYQEMQVFEGDTIEVMGSTAIPIQTTSEAMAIVVSICGTALVL